MKAAVVGGGITGCATALRLAGLGHSVVLYEQDACLGGVLRDWELDGAAYLSGCHYLNPEAAWFAEIRDELNCDFNEFEHRYASWNRFEGQEIFRKDMAAPVIEAVLPPLQGPATGPHDLKARFDLYGAGISNILSKYARRFGSGTLNLDQSCAIGLQLSEIYLPGHDELALKAKQTSTLANELIALPRHVRRPGSPFPKAVIPAEGFNSFFRAIQEVLVKRGVRVALEAPVTPRMNSGRNGVDLFERGVQLHNDLLVWCGSPVSLFHACGLGRMDNKSVDMVHVHGNILGAAHVAPIYIQCYVDDSLVYRIYAYPLAGRVRFCLECIDGEGIDSESLLNTAKAVLSFVDVSGEFFVAGFQRRKNYALYSIEDMARMAGFEEINQNAHVIGGAWREFGRDAKIQQISLSIDKLVP